jgi:hypothetical protein
MVICVNCNAAMKIHRVGVPVIEETKPALKVRCGDVYQCRYCNSQVVSNFGDSFSPKSDPQSWKIKPVMLRGSE